MACGRLWRKEIKPRCVSPDFQEMLNIILVEVDDGEATKLREWNASFPTRAGSLRRERHLPFSVFAVMNIIKLQNQLRRLQRRAASDLPADQKTGIRSFRRPASCRRHRGYVLKCVLALIFQRLQTSLPPKTQSFSRPSTSWRR